MPEDFITEYIVVKKYSPIHNKIVEHIERISFDLSNYEFGGYDRSRGVMMKLYIHKELLQ